MIYMVFFSPNWFRILYIIGFILWLGITASPNIWVFALYILVVLFIFLVVVGPANSIYYSEKPDEGKGPPNE